mmetsp:Transcript_21557/g.27879  ORF Transcript_21557/g.27879 Transcript_21557/m.27879 type:complete len:196 (-) Transcript_21557:422-1009(-)|eukprot:CAMPEP_0198145878 /NCGR_PEP_ID=MMETSP1443-20131203/25885_1 /TAXON_ID=186043 /ORGANISM="Entomoneis sp., Strain CCMP2396" /LENGTH=195 /DNA_ID=CAMNT_0043809635 /DNA_START=251 /DNA_END=838 /DNA_ORIENTATION=-
MTTSVPPLSGTTKGSTSTAQWPCANCHAMVSEDRCPFCHGIQATVRITKNEDITGALGAWIERVSPATVRGGTPLSPQAFLTPQTERMHVMHTGIVSGSTEYVQINEDVDEELEQNSECSSRRGYEEERIFGGGRPNNPVAFLLATAESPLPKFETRIEEASVGRSEDRKKSSKERVDEDPSGSGGKKPRILFAM